MGDRFDSDFERDVYHRLIARDYRVKVQYRVGRFRINVVAEGRHGRLAVEFDGDTYHNPDRREADRSRQVILERLVKMRGDAARSCPRPVLVSVNEPS